jgi:hypothetical protein
MGIFFDKDMLMLGCISREFVFVLSTISIVDLRITLYIVNTVLMYVWNIRYTYSALPTYQHSRFQGQIIIPR